MEKVLNNLKSGFSPASVGIIVSVLLIGGFNEFISCFLSVLFVAFLLAYCIKNGRLNIYLNIISFFAVFTVISYLVVSFWATDSGEAIIGFFKFLPVLLFTLLIMQGEREPYDSLKLLPYLCAVLTVVSFAFEKLDILAKYFSVAGRISGTMQYPNSFALLLLVGLIITASNEKLTAADFVLIPILLAGIILTGSRTVFVLTALSVIVLVFLIKNKKIKFSLLSAGVVLVAAAVIYAYFSGNFSSIGRFLTISLTESTFVGRLLYFKDALPVILKHPFGLGYMGYYFIQTEVQTGVYSVVYIHNDLLQLMLDVGWIPGIVYVVAAGMSMFNKNISIYRKMIIAVIFLHTLFDFDLQFISVFLIFISASFTKDGREYEFSVPKAASATVTSLLAVINIYMCLALALSYFNNYEASRKLYKYNTLNNISFMESVTDAEQRNKIADEIISQNERVPQAYDVKSVYYYSKGDFKKVISYKNKALKINKFEHETRVNYCIMLLNGIRLYEQAGDQSSAEICKKELAEAYNGIKTLDSKLSKLGTMIKDQPDTTVNEDIEKEILKLIN